MNFFRKKRVALRGVMDVGADAIKTVLFEAPAEVRAGVAFALPRIRDKFVWDLPVSSSPLRRIKKIRESVFATTEKIGRIPDAMLIALGPEIAEYRLENWTVSPPENPILTRAGIHAAYQRMFEKHADLRRATIAAPVEMMVNGYPLTWQENWHTERIVPPGQPVEIRFRTLALAMSIESGAAFTEVKEGLAGIALEFIPLVIAFKEAITHGLAMRDAFLIDVGAEATTLVSVRDGRLMHAAVMPCGIRRMAQVLARIHGSSLRGARTMIREYAEGAAHLGLPAAVPDACREAAGEWKRMFVRALDAFYATGPLASQVLLTGGGSRLAEIRREAQASDWLGGFSFSRTPSVRVLDGAAFFGGDTLGGNLNGPEDAGLAALMIYSLRHHPLF